MARNLAQMMGQKADEASDVRWVTCVPALVAENEDPENQHRIKVVCPMLDEFRVRDQWIKQLVAYVGVKGYGSFSIPEKESEVVLFGQLAQKHNLYYMPVYNEDFVVAKDFRNQESDSADTTTCGFRVPGMFKLISQLLMQLRGSRIRIEADATIELKAPGGVFINGRSYGN